MLILVKLLLLNNYKRQFKSIFEINETKYHIHEYTTDYIIVYPADTEKEACDIWINSNQCRFKN